MKFKMFLLTLLSVFIGMLVTPLISFAQDAAVLAPADFLSQVIEAVKAFGGLSQMAKISSIVLVLVASMKVSFLNELLWSKLGKLQVYVAPVLGLVAGILSLMGTGQPLTLAAAFAYLSAGAGAVFLHEILDSLKGLPGLGSIYVTIINLISGALGGPKPQA